MDHNIPTLNVQVPQKAATGNNADISELVKFGWYQRIYYCDATTSFTLSEEELVKYLGPSEKLDPR